MTLSTDVQRDGAWFAARAGRATASRFKDVLAKLKNGAPAAARQNYLMDVVTERLTGSPVTHFTTTAMTWGTDLEEIAKVAYADYIRVGVDETGFWTHDTMMAGDSPDGLVNWEGLVEIKCPFNSANHVATWRDGMPDEHMAQIQGQLWITGRDWCDFVSFDPRMPGALRLYVQRIERDDDYIASLETEVRSFLTDVDAMVSSLMNKAQLIEESNHVRA